MRLVCLMAASAAAVWAQSNQIQICDQGAPGARHCVIWKAPASLPLSPAPVTVSAKSGGVIFGLDYTDMSILPGAVVSGDALISASSATNASILSMAATPATGGADISVGKTGSGTLLPLRFLRNPNEVMRIDVNNLLLLGRTADDGTGAKFQVKGDVSFQTTSTATQHGLMLDQYTTDTVPAHLLLDKARGTSASPSIVANGDGIGAILFRAHNGSSFQVPADVFAKAVVSGGNIGADLFFDTRAPGGALTDRMVITNAGHVLIGSTTDDGSGNALQLTGGCSGCGVVWPLVVPGGTAAPQIDASALAGRFTIQVPNSLQIDHTDGEALIINNAGGASTTEGYLLMHAGARGEIFRIRATSLSAAAADKSAVIDAPGALYYGVDYQTARHYFYGASIFLGLGTSGGAWTGNVYVNTASDDGSGARLQLAGYMSASSGYYSASSASNAINVPAGGALLAGVETVTSNNSSPRGLISSEYTSSDFAASVFLRKAGGSSGSPSAVTNGHTISSIVSSAYDGSAWQYPAYVATRAVVSGGNVGADMAFAVRAPGGSLVERLKLTNDGTIIWTDNTGEIGRLGTSRRLQLGLASSDVSNGIGSVVISDAFISATATANATVGSFGAVAGNYVAVVSTRTGSGTFQPLAFFTNGAERARIRVDGVNLFGLTSTDLSVLPGALVTADTFASVTATANASTISMAAVAGSYGAIASSKTGSGTYLPMALFTSAAERVRILTAGNVLIARTSDNGSGAMLQVHGKTSFEDHVHSTGNAITSCTANVGTCTMSSGSNDTRGAFTLNTAPATATLTFAAAYSSAPFCTVSVWGSAPAGVSTRSTTGIVITANGTAEINYHCIE